MFWISSFSETKWENCYSQVRKQIFVKMIGIFLFHLNTIRLYWCFISLLLFGLLHFLRMLLFTHLFLCFGSPQLFCQSYILDINFKMSIIVLTWSERVFKTHFFDKYRFSEKFRPITVWKGYLYNDILMWLLLFWQILYCMSLRMRKNISYFSKPYTSKNY